MAGVEINGCANQITYIRIYRLKHPEGIDPEVNELLGKIEREAWDSISYMKWLENPTGKLWHQIKSEA